MWRHHIRSIGALIIRRIMGRIMAMDRIPGTVMGTTEAGEAIGTTEATEEGTGIGGTKKSGKIPPRGNEMNAG